MATDKPPVGTDPEITAITVVYDALKELEPAAQRRTLEYVARRLNLPSAGVEEGSTLPDTQDRPPAVSRPSTETEKIDDDSEGISPVAVRWMRRSGFSASSLSALFSLGVDEIDLVAKTVPGANKRQRMHSVLLLKGISAYLSTGVARVTHEQLKEACLHYDAFDGANFATYLKDFAAESSGTKESGYTLTARGLTAATEIIKGIVKAPAGTK